MFLCANLHWLLASSVLCVHSLPLEKGSLSDTLSTLPSSNYDANPKPPSTPEQHKSIDHFLNCGDVEGPVEPLLGFNQTCHSYISGTIDSFTERAKLLCCFDASTLPCCSPYARRFTLDEKCCATCDLARTIWKKQKQLHGQQFKAFQDDHEFCQAIHIAECWSLKIAARCPSTCGLTAKCFPGEA